MFNNETTTKKDDKGTINLGELVLLIEEIEHTFSHNDNDYSADFINVLLHDLNDNKIKVCAASILEQLEEETIQKIKLTHEDYIFIPIQTYYDNENQNNRNHWAALVVDKVNSLIFYLDPAKTGSELVIPENVEKLKTFIFGDEKQFILNPIDFQQKEKKEKFIRHCGVYVIEIFKIFSECIKNGKIINESDLANNETTFSLQTALSPIPCGKAEDVVTIRKEHRLKCKEILTNNTVYKIPDILNDMLKPATINNNINSNQQHNQQNKKSQRPTSFYIIKDQKEKVGDFISDDIQELFYICPIDKLGSILKNGIKSHDRAKRLYGEGGTDISSQDIQERRKKIKLERTDSGKTSLNLHKHALLFLNPHNMMMDRLVKENKKTEICCLRVRRQILDRGDVVLSNRNAAVNPENFEIFTKEKFRLSPESNRMSFFQRPYFAKDKEDSEVYEKRKQVRQSEIQVPYEIDKSYIDGIFVVDNNTKKRVQEIISESGEKLTAGVVIHPSLFFSQFNNTNLSTTWLQPFVTLETFQGEKKFNDNLPESSEDESNEDDESDEYIIKKLTK